MAFGQGKQSTESNGNFAKYVGVASVKILAVNPTMNEWNKVTGGNMQKEPEYISTTNEGIKQARITLLVQPKDTEVVIPVTFWFRKAPIQGTQSGKFQIIDKYGRTAWATKEDIEAKQIPQYSNGPANIDIDYRRIVSGEAQFTDFLKAYLNIPALSYRDKNGNVIINPNPSDCEARLDNIMKIFDGDFSEIKKILSYQKENYVKMLFGVKVTDDGKEYQDVFMDLFLTNGNNNHVRFSKELTNSLSSGRQTYAKTYFGETNPDGTLIISDFHERVITPTTFTETKTEIPTDNNDDDDMPF